MEALQNINQTFNTFDNKKQTYDKGLKAELIKAIQTIEDKIEKVQINDNLSYKKSRNTVKKNLFSDFETGAINAKLMRAFNIALTLEFRGIKDLMIVNQNLTIAQLETAATYFTKAEIKDVIGSSEPVATYKSIVTSYQVPTTSKKLDTTKKKVSGK